MTTKTQIEDFVTMVVTVFPGIRNTSLFSSFFNPSMLENDSVVEFFKKLKILSDKIGKDLSLDSNQLERFKSSISSQLVNFHSSLSPPPSSSNITNPSLKSNNPSNSPELSTTSSIQTSNRPSLRRANFLPNSIWTHSPPPADPESILESNDYYHIFPRAPSNEPNILGEKSDFESCRKKLGFPLTGKLSSQQSEIIKKHRRLVKNRESAHLSRLRKKTQLQDLQKQTDVFSSRNSYLEAKVAFLEQYLQKTNNFHLDPSVSCSSLFFVFAICLYISCLELDNSKQ